ncbi:MAG: hypothetical protein ABSG59_01315 [Verrucomicrobiota bacterium]
MKRMILSLMGLVLLAFSRTACAENGSAPIHFSEITAKATADYHGDALAIAATPGGARLRCGFQKLEGRVTTQGLWIGSADPAAGSRLRLTADALCRESSRGRECSLTERTASKPRPPGVGDCMALEATGNVAVEDKLVRFTRTLVAEEYSVSVDGVRQDFVILERPAGLGDLRVELALAGARAEAAGYGAKLIVEGSGPTLAYSGLRAEDATGRELTARLEVLSANRLAVRVVDADAVYPVRIDPTFSDVNWVSLNPGMLGADAQVLAITVDGSGNVYVGGEFIVIGTVRANGIAKWNGSNWSALGSGVGGGSGDGPFGAGIVLGTSVFALACDSYGNVYAGGNFTTAGGVAANGVAVWNGSTWSALGSGVTESYSGYSSPVYALAVSGTNLYAGGSFNTAGGVAANNVALWNGSAWSALGSGMNGAVYALTVSGTTLYAGGDFTTADGVAANYIAAWNGITWSALGSGMGGGSAYIEPEVCALAASGTNVYAGGLFTTAGGVPANYIAAWNGNAWSALGSGMNTFVYALAANGTNLYAGGEFQAAGGVGAEFVAAWNGSTWSALGLGTAGTLGALAVNGTNLYAGGLFYVAGGASVHFIAAWNGSAWSALGSGMNNGVSSLAVSGGTLYAGGGFVTAGGVTVNSIAAWNGNAWSALGSGLTGNAAPGFSIFVSALAVSGGTLYAGGDITTAGGVTARGVAAWNGSNWSALGSGLSGYLGQVDALAVSGGTLYAGGAFTTAGGVTANGIAAWNGSNWSAVGSGMGGAPTEGPEVYALAVSDTNLYAGGWFTNAGGVAANYIAAWSGSTWSALGSGMGGVPIEGFEGPHVYALAVSGTNLYAGGWFTTAGGVAANNIAVWNGSAWSALGSGVSGSTYPGYNSYVSALAVSGGILYAGGNFTNAGGVPANCIAAWNGSTWSALGSGIGGPSNPGQSPSVNALAADGSAHLFVGGDFSLAGTNVSPFIAQANIGPGVDGGNFGGLTYSPAIGFNFTFSGATIGQPYSIQRSPSLVAGSWTNLTNFTYIGPAVITDPYAAEESNTFYRAVSP